MSLEETRVVAPSHLIVITTEWRTLGCQAVKILRRSGFFSRFRTDEPVRNLEKSIYFWLKVKSR